MYNIINTNLWESKPHSFLWGINVAADDEKCHLRPCLIVLSHKWLMVVYNISEHLYIKPSEVSLPCQNLLLLACIECRHDFKRYMYSPNRMVCNISTGADLKYNNPWLNKLMPGESTVYYSLEFINQPFLKFDQTVLMNNGSVFQTWVTLFTWTCPLTVWIRGFDPPSSHTKFSEPVSHFQRVSLWCPLSARDKAPCPQRCNFYGYYLIQIDLWIRTAAL